MEMEVVASPPPALLKGYSSDVGWVWGGREDPRTVGSLPKSKLLLPTIGVDLPEAQECPLLEEEEEEGEVLGPLGVVQALGEQVVGECQCNAWRPAK